MHLVYALEESPEKNLPSIFLAGPTPRQRSTVRSWRPRAIRTLKKLGFNGVVYIPENRIRSAKIDHKKQPKWEHRMLFKSSCVLFWVPRNTKRLPGFTTNIEFGLFSRSGKVSFGAPKRAHRIDYMRFMADEFDIPQSWKLEDAIRTAIAISNKPPRINGKDYEYCPFCGSRLGVKILENKKFKHCQECNWTYFPGPDIAVAAIVTKINEEFRPMVLMVKRKREPFKNTWMFPAGFLELGEHPEETLNRELHEETGHTVESFQLGKILKSVSDPRSPDHLVIFYHAKAMGEIVNNDTDENSDIQWKFVSDEIDVGFPTHKAILEEIRSSYRI